MDPRRLRVPLLVAVFAVPGCSQLQLASAGATACAPKSIEIRNVERSWSAESWEAVCDGRTFRCSQVSTAWSVDVTCTPVGPDGAPAGEHAVEAGGREAGAARGVDAEEAAADGEGDDADEEADAGGSEAEEETESGDEKVEGDEEGSKEEDTRGGAPGDTGGETDVGSDGAEDADDDGDGKTAGEGEGG